MPYKDKEKQKAACLKYKHKTKKWFWEYKETLSCEKCGFSHPAAIQFHHLDPNEKENNISRMVNKNLNKETIMEEIKKCIILCANCHAILHYGKDSD